MCQQVDNNTKSKKGKHLNYEEQGKKIPWKYLTLKYIVTLREFWIYIIFVCHKIHLVKKSTQNKLPLIW